jgi:transposase
MTDVVQDKAKRRIIGYADFMEVWEKSATADEAAKLLGTTKMAVVNRASQLRKAGIPLKAMPKSDGRKRDLNKALAHLATIRQTTFEEVKAESLKLTEKPQETTAPQA